jgi:serine/threonine protein kinase
MLCHGGCIVQTQSRIYKISFARRFELEAENRIRDLVVQNRSDLAPLLVSSEFYSKRFFSCIAMPRYEVVGLEESIGYGIDLFNHMKERSAFGKSQLMGRAAEHIELGLTIVSQVCSPKLFKYLKSVVEAYLASKRYTVGVVHGDFHSRNILLESTGSPKLIDLDCLQLNGIQE